MAEKRAARPRKRSGAPTETPQRLLPEDGPCGCRGIHPGVGHEEHGDALWRRQNTAMLDRAVELRESDPLHAWLALWGHAQAEEVRLRHKRYQMLAGRWP